MLVGLSYFICKNEIDDRNSKHPLSACYVSGRYKTLHPFQLTILTVSPWENEVEGLVKWLSMVKEEEAELRFEPSSA